jgi:SAM-dependent methyltransferase
MQAGPVPLIFDAALSRARLARALRQGYEPFLLDRIAADALDRLAAVKRRFAQALDLATPTAGFAQALLASGQAERVTRAAPVAATGGDIVAGAEAPPFAEGAFDLAVSLLALQSVDDLPGALARIRRALRPDGLFIGALFGGATLNELRRALVQAETEIAGGASPRVAPFADVREMGGLLQRAGFALPVADVDRVVVRYGDLFALLRDLRRMGLTNALVERSRAPASRALFLRAAAIYAADFADADGRVRATFDIVWLSGWAPHETQPKPLKPGSATARLADALGARERQAGEKVGS